MVNYKSSCMSLPTFWNSSMD